eukprot:TRINITY_DN4942_c1_g1_i3.p1 TRINITY_DN4942_c1_g1~~TRINITY_DN4942_c1_g1_i3.p1  ORF type:complete len:239 (-),score=38.85 TRINITY_DN4942_c1_g1_i3:59-775(-)
MINFDGFNFSRDELVFIGFGIKSKPIVVKEAQLKLSVIQICNGSTCLLIRISDLDTLPPLITAILENPLIIKMGISVNMLIDKIGKCFPDTELRGFCEITNMLYHYGVKNKRKRNLSHLCITILGKRFRNDPEINLSRWDNPYLSISQRNFAALEIYVIYAVGNALKEKIVKRDNQDMENVKIDAYERLNACFEDIKSQVTHVILEKSDPALLSAISFDDTLMKSEIKFIISKLQNSY